MNAIASNRVLLKKLILGTTVVVVLIGVAAYLLMGLLACGWLDQHLHLSKCVQSLYAGGTRTTFASDLTTVVTLLYTAPEPTLKVWRVKNGKLYDSGHAIQGLDATFSPDGTILATRLKNMIQIWQTSDWTLLRSWQAGKGHVQLMTYSPDGTMLATTETDNILRIWNMSDGTMVQQLQGSKEQRGTQIYSIAFSSDGTIVAAGFNYGTIQLWEISEAQLFYTLKEETDVILSLAFSPDDTLLASGGWGDDKIRLWRVRDGELWRILKGHTGAIIDLAFSPGGKILASGSRDCTGRLWRVADGVQLRTLRHDWLPDGYVKPVAFSLDGTILATAERYGPIRFFEIETLEGISSY